MDTKTSERCGKEQPNQEHMGAAVTLAFLGAFLALFTQLALVEASAVLVSIQKAVPFDNPLPLLVWS